MSDEVKHSVIWGTTVTIVLSSVVWGIAWYMTTTTRTAMENGYSQKQMAGQYGTFWTKE